MICVILRHMVAEPIKEVMSSYSNEHDAMLNERLLDLYNAESKHKAHTVHRS